MPDSPCPYGSHGSHWGLCDICNAAGKACTPVPDWNLQDWREQGPECTRCCQLISWEGDDPECEEDAICNDCAWKELEELRASRPRLPSQDTARDMWLLTPLGSMGRTQIQVEQYEELRNLAIKLAWKAADRLSHKEWLVDAVYRFIAVAENSVWEREFVDPDYVPVLQELREALEATK